MPYSPPGDTRLSQSDRRTDPSIRRARFQGLAPKTPLVTRTRARSWEKGRAPCRLPGVTAEVNVRTSEVQHAQMRSAPSCTGGKKTRTRLPITNTAREGSAGSHRAWDGKGHGGRTVLTSAFGTVWTLKARVFWEPRFPPREARRGEPAGRAGDAGPGMQGRRGLSPEPHLHTGTRVSACVLCMYPWVCAHVHACLHV